VQKTFRLFALAILFAAFSGTAPAQTPSTPLTPKEQQSPSQQNPAAPAPAQDQQQLPTIRVTTGLVRLIATVTDKRHNFITDLEQRDFKVSEDGVPQDIQLFSRETNLPLRIGLLLDTSNSIRPRLGFEQDAAIDFLSSVIRRNKDMAFLMTFDNEPEIIQDFTGDVSLLSSAIRRQRAGGGTALNDAIYRAAEIIANPPLPSGPDQEVRRVLVVISDGDDNLSDHALTEAIEAAIRAEASIYTISTNIDWLSVSGDTPHKLHIVGGDKILQEFADQSGGRAFFPYKVDDLAQSFVDIGMELRSQYFIAYAPTNPLSNGKYRKIEVQTDRKALIVRTRRGYFATAPASTPAPKKNPG
jgi:VWFA-related protein